MLTFPIRLAVRRPHPPTKWARLGNAARKSPICPHPWAPGWLGGSRDAERIGP